MQNVERGGRDLYNSIREEIRLKYANELELADSLKL